MKTILCTLPNASTLINGIEFKETPEGMLSVPVEDSVAADFATIPGYEAVELKPESKKQN